MPQPLTPVCLQLSGSRQDLSTTCLLADKVAGTLSPVRSWILVLRTAPPLLIVVSVCDVAPQGRWESQQDIFAPSQFPRTLPRPASSPSTYTTSPASAPVPFGVTPPQNPEPEQGSFPPHHSLPSSAFPAGRVAKLTCGRSRRPGSSWSGSRSSLVPLTSVPAPFLLWGTGPGSSAVTASAASG